MGMIQATRAGMSHRADDYTVVRPRFKTESCCA